MSTSWKSSRSTRTGVKRVYAGCEWRSGRRECEARSRRQQGIAMPSVEPGGAPEKVLAFSAIGQPQQFYNFLKDYNVVKTIDFDDHHNYTQADINKLQQICTNSDVQKLVTTEKDGGKCSNLNFYLSVYALKLKTELNVWKLLNGE